MWRLLTLYYTTVDKRLSGVSFGAIYCSLDGWKKIFFLENIYILQVYVTAGIYYGYVIVLKLEYSTSGGTYNDMINQNPGKY